MREVSKGFMDMQDIISKGFRDMQKDISEGFYNMKKEIFRGFYNTGRKHETDSAVGRRKGKDTK